MSFFIKYNIDNIYPNKYRKDIVIMHIIEKIEEIMDFGGTKKDILFLIVSAFALFISIFDLFSLPFDTTWIAIIFCGTPIIIEAIIGLITKFDIKADVLVSLALIAAIFIGEDFAAGEVAFIMQLGAFLEDLTVSKARAGIERFVKLTPQEARLVCEDGEKKILDDDVKKVTDLEFYPEKQYRLMVLY